MHSISIFFLNCFMQLILCPTSNGIHTIPDELSELFDRQETAHVMIIMEEPVEHVFASIKARRFEDSAEKTTTMVSELRQYTENSQQNLMSFLSRKSILGEVEVEPFWITNRISIESATRILVQDILDNHGHVIAHVREAIVIHLDDDEMIPDEPEVDRTKTGAFMPWGVANIHAEQAHNAGYTGKGIVIAVMDTGARKTHEAIKDTMLSSYNWFDAQNGTKSPVDSNGHGTHCIGTIAGRYGIGVAPDSKWCACRIFGKKPASERIILKCAQWITCPTKSDGSGEDCSKKAHIVSNSWGGGHGKEWFYDAIDAWRTADIIPVFAIGNSGPKCKTANSPGDSPGVISVGATDPHNYHTSFSSRGPTAHKKPALKPEICAPGKKIMSASKRADNQYVALSGTSMACPHVSGAVAVLLSKNPDATFDQILNALQSTAYEYRVQDHACNHGSTFPSIQWPNCYCGAGIIRLDAALQHV